MSDRFGAWMGRWGILGVCCGLIVLVLWTLPTMIAAAGNEGRFGTFTAEFEHCHKGDCDWTGVFVSDDGAIRRHDVAYKGGGVEGVGDTTRVQWLASDAHAVYEEGDDGWVLGVLIALAATGYVIWWVAARRWRR